MAGQDERIVDEGLLRGVQDPERPQGYVGREGMYLILSSYSKRWNMSKHPEAPSEIALNIERVLGWAAADGEHGYTMMLLLKFADRDTCRAAEERLARIVKGMPTLAVRREEADELSVILEPARPLRALESVTAGFVPEAVKVFNKLFPSLALSREVAVECGKTAEQSDSALVE